MIHFKKRSLRKGKKSTESGRNSSEACKKSTVDVPIHVPLRKISDREIALGYILW